ncbi:hypothetical protein LG275_03765 [Chryseomicrobium palamuruense]
MDISTGRCPTKRVECDCHRVCARLYGQEVRRLKKVIEESSPENKEKAFDEWRRFVEKNLKKL